MTLDSQSATCTLAYVLVTVVVGSVLWSLLMCTIYLSIILNRRQSSLFLVFLLRRSIHVGSTSRPIGSVLSRRLLSLHLQIASGCFACWSNLKMSSNQAYFWVIEDKVWWLSWYGDLQNRENAWVASNINDHNFTTALMNFRILWPLIKKYLLQH